MKRKGAIIFLSLLLSIFLSGCNQSAKETDGQSGNPSPKPTELQPQPAAQQAAIQTPTSNAQQTPEQTIAEKPVLPLAENKPNDNKTETKPNVKEQETTQKELTDTKPTAQSTATTQKAEATAAKPTTTQAPPASPTPAPVEPKQQTVTLSITGDKSRGIVLGQTKIEVQKGDTVLDALKRITRAKGIQMEFSGAGLAAYVQGIDNLYEFDLGPKSGWMYRVNGKFGSQSAGSHKINPRDQIDWLYTEDLGKDLGARAAK